ncbi:MFS transporter [Bradyrhizobium sp. NAS80.1]|uniref:MFS transporter n=1 Tax=Bradyrhizobium sp. NAS80.1 TaxID=1680159 RepID=UPI000961386D|nr:MFS transporter [Bradyrhizobium sp. NAS80.1]OKO85366.1 MFS transporter [Bradyrhizobium sp. NAS80.1]
MSSVAQQSSLAAIEGVRASGQAAAVKGAVLSEFIDLFDIYLPAIVLTPVLFYFQPSVMDESTQAILASLVFVTTMLGRPIGSLFFGLIADTLGRRMASIYSVAGFGLFTFLIALLPGYDTIGIASFWLLLLLRFLDGICLGGGYTGAIPLAFEYTKKNERGFVGGLILAAFPAAYIAINLVSMLMFALFPLEGPTSPYVEWGWRIPFILGAAFAGLLLLYYIYNVAESEIWQRKAGPRNRMKISDLFRGRSGRDLTQILVMMTGFWLTQNIITIFVPTTLLTQFLHLSRFELTSTMLLSYAVLMFTYIASGMIGQKIGRRRFFVIAGPLIATVGSGILYILVSAQGLSLPTTMFLVCLMSVLVTSPWGVLVTYINERFATDVRATGFGFGYSLSVIIPSFYAFYLNWIGKIMPFHLAPVLLLCLGGLIGALGAGLGPETKDVDL